MGKRTAYHQKYNKVHPERKVSAADRSRQWRQTPENQETYRGYIRARMLRHRLQAIELLGGECLDCGWAGDPDGFEFDHLPERGMPDRTVGMHRSWVRIKAELKKCELVCGTCHNIRTARRRAA